MSSNRLEKFIIFLAYMSATLIVFFAIVTIEQNALAIIHHSQLDGCARGNKFKTLLATDLHMPIPIIDCVKAYPSPNLF